MFDSHISPLPSSLPPPPPPPPPPPLSHPHPPIIPSISLSQGAEGARGPQGPDGLLGPIGPQGYAVRFQSVVHLYPYFTHPSPSSLHLFHHSTSRGPRDLRDLLDPTETLDPQVLLVPLAQMPSAARVLSQSSTLARLIASLMWTCPMTSTLMP